MPQSVGNMISAKPTCRAGEMAVKEIPNNLCGGAKGQAKDRATRSRSQAGSVHHKTQKDGAILRRERGALSQQGPRLLLQEAFHCKRQRASSKACSVELTHLMTFSMHRLIQVGPCEPAKGPGM
mmetsp:Transcript_34712/g.64618  ORF Transcript_34712/g.64618 Transcript_34712/m.64618 type:complete len:124 (+) Transcript_34712:122-493(+)